MHEARSMGMEVVEIDREGCGNGRAGMLL